MREEILLAVARALLKRWWYRTIQDLHTRPRILVHIDPVEARILVRASRTDSPNLAGWKRVSTDSILAVDFWRDHKVLNAVRADLIAEVRIAELCAPNPLLLLLDSPPAFHREPDRPFKVFI